LILALFSPLCSHRFVLTTFQDRELHRITNAGGFVNQFGRVNGNLNLSRSIGDLKYKQVPGIHPSGQMITAEPDIVE
jgi:serine/threonine protein phosphatase PrpC